MGKTEQTPDLSLRFLLKFILSNVRTFVIVGLIAAIASVIAALLMTEYFTSQVILFPARTNSITLDNNGVKRGNISDFGEEEESEQLLQIISSEDLKERIISRHNLYEHYEIEKTDKHSRSQIFKTYDEFVSARRTKFNSVEISVTDTDPKMAADMANSIAEFVDTVKNRMIRERARTSMKVIDDLYIETETRLSRMNSKLDSLHELGVGGEGERASVYRAYGSAMENSDRATAAQLKKQIDMNKLHGEEFDILRRQRDQTSDEYLRLLNFRQQFETDANLSIPQKFLVDRAVPADKKSKPIRWLIVIGSIAAALLFALIMLLLRETLPALLS